MEATKISRKPGPLSTLRRLAEASGPEALAAMTSAMDPFQGTDNVGTREVLALFDALDRLEAAGLDPWSDLDDHCARMAAAAFLARLDSLESDAEALEEQARRNAYYAAFGEV